MKKISVLLSFLLLFTQMFVFNNQALAKDLTNQVINDINIVKQDGSSGEFSHRERAKISVSFAGNGTKISTNDTLSVNLPKELLGFNSSIALKNSEGITLGTCNVTKSSIDCTFNDNVEKLDNIRGEFFFEAEINKSEEGKHNVNLDFGNTNITKTITVNNGSASGVESDEIFYKSGQILPDDIGNIQWALRFNNKQDYFRGNDPALISDTLGSGMELNKDSLQLSVKQINEAQPRFYSVEEFENAGLGNVDVNGNNINVRFNTPSYNELMVYYSTKITDNSLKSFENQSSATYIDKNEKQVTENSNATVQNVNSGGKAEGDLAKFSGKVVINKVGNDGNGNSKPLEGAEFELVNLDGEVVGKGTTDSNGSLVFDNIKGGTHTLKETKIPDGYKIDEANFPNQVVLDFEKNKEINLNVVNIKEPTTEEPTTEEPTTEEPTTEEPTTEEPTTEEPTTEEPTTEEPTTEEPTTEEPTTEEPTTEEPTTEEPTTEEPTTEEPTTEEPTTEEPTTEEPTTEEPTTEEPTTEEPTTEEPTTEEPTTEEPTTEEPTTEEPTTEEPTTEEPTTEEPTTEEPTTEEPTTEEPTTEEPTTEEPTTEEPTTEEPTTEEPTTEEPTTEEPTTEEPTTEEPTTEEPTTEEPTTEEPTTEEPTTEEPTTEEPTTEEINQGESITNKSTEEKINKDQQNKKAIEDNDQGKKDQVRHNHSEKAGIIKGAPEKSQQKDNGKSQDSDNKGGVLPNTGEVIQNHPIITTASILLLLVFGIYLVFYRRKQQ